MRLILVDLDNLLDEMQKWNPRPAQGIARVVVAMNTVTARRAGLDRIRQWSAGLGAGPLELALVPRRPQAADAALLRLLTQSPDADGVGPFGAVDVLTFDRGLLGRTRELLGNPRWEALDWGIRFLGQRVREHADEGVGLDPVDLSVDLSDVAALVERCSFPRAQVGLGRATVSGVARLGEHLTGKGALLPAKGVHRAHPATRHEESGWLDGPISVDPIDLYAVAVRGDPRPFSTELPPDWLSAHPHRPLPVRSRARFRPGYGASDHLAVFEQRVIDDAALETQSSGPWPDVTIRLEGVGEGTRATMRTPELWWMCAPQNQYGRLVPTDRLRFSSKLLEVGEVLWLKGVLAPLQNGGWPELVVQASARTITLHRPVAEMQVHSLGDECALLVGPTQPAGAYAAVPVQALSPGELAVFFPCDADELSFFRRLPLLVVPPVRPARVPASIRVGEP
jgi:hypothetical protein